MQATHATAAAELNPQPRCHHKQELPQLLMETIQQKHAVYAAWQQKEQRWQQLSQDQQASTNLQQVAFAKAGAAKARRKYHFLSRLVTRRGEKQRNAQLAAHMRKAERQWQAGHLAACHKTVSKMLGTSPPKLAHRAC